MPRYHDPNPDREPRDWQILSGQGQVLAALAAAPERTMRQLAYGLGYGERRITGFIRELEAADMLTRCRIGRHNRYTLNPAASARIPFLPAATVGDVLRGIHGERQEV